MLDKPKKITVKQPKEFLRLKIGMFGDAAVGKTSIVTRYTTNTFTMSYNPTVAVDYQNKVVETSDYNINLNLFDFSGHPEFFDVRTEFYKDINAILLIFDLTHKRSLESLDSWVKEIEENAGLLKELKLPVFVIGNKKDVGGVGGVGGLGGSRARMWGAEYREVSASEEGGGVEEMMSDVVKKCMEGG